MSTPNYAQNRHPADNLKELLRAQNSSGIEKAVYEGAEPIDVLVAKAVTNANHAAQVLGSVPAGGSTGQVLSKLSNADGDADWTAVSTVGDVTAASAFGSDNRLLRSDGSGKAVQSSSVQLDDAGNLTNITSVEANSVQAAGIVLASGGISINKDLVSDNSYSGVTITGINGGENISQWEAVYFSFTDGEWMKASASLAGKFPAAGIAVASTTNGAPAVVLTSGIIRHDAWSWSAGALYLSTTTGGLTQTSPSSAGECVQPIGWAITPDIVFLNFNQAYGEVV